MSKPIFKRCTDFAELRAAALNAVEGNMDLFEKLFVIDTEEPIIHDGEWPPLSAYTEQNWLDAPQRYPVIVCGSLSREYDRYTGENEIVSWFWTHEDEL